MCLLCCPGIPARPSGGKASLVLPSLCTKFSLPFPPNKPLINVPGCAVSFRKQVFWHPVAPEGSPDAHIPKRCQEQIWIILRKQQELGLPAYPGQISLRSACPTQHGQDQHPAGLQCQRPALAEGRAWSITGGICGVRSSAFWRLCPFYVTWVVLGLYSLI